MAPESTISPQPQPQPQPPTISTPSSRMGSRRQSTHLASPLIAPLPNILPSNTDAVLGSPRASPMMPVDNTGVGYGPGPVRHPRPLTAAELHLQLEKEQEAVVNRLTRELSLLRAAQNASVASNHSSVSGSGFADSNDANNNHIISGPSHPVPSTRPGIHNRTTSSGSSIYAGRPRTASQVSVNHMIDSNPSSRFPNSSTTANDRGTNTSLSRQNSTISQASSISRRSEISSPAQPIPIPIGGQFAHIDRRQSLSRRDTNTSNMAQYSPSANGSEMGVPVTSVSVPATGRYEEIAYWRSELEKQREENEKLRSKIRELEAGNKKGVKKTEEERGRLLEPVSAVPSGLKREGSADSGIDSTASVQGSVMSGAAGGLGGAGGAGEMKMRSLTETMQKTHIDEEIHTGESAASTNE